MAQRRKPGAGKTNPAPTEGYPSASDIPRFRELIEKRDALRLLLPLNPSLRPTFKELDDRLAQLISSVDDFYELLAPRNWVFHETLSVTELREALDSKDADALERAIIAQYKDERRLDVLVNGLKHIPEMRPRIPLLLKAKTDYRAERFYSVVLVLLTVMDGFVNDVEGARGLHARSENEMVAWDNATGHHLGLRNAHRSFKKFFNKTDDKEIFELHRNGIMHGVLTNFDNEVVASKAWNRLFAVADWAQSVERGKVPETPPATWAQTMETIQTTAKDRSHTTAWRPRSVTSEDPSFSAEPVVRAAVELFTHWATGNYGGMSFRLKTIGKPKSRGERAGQVRDNFRGYTLDEFRVFAMTAVAPAVSTITAELTVNGSTIESESRWVYEGAKGRPLTESQPGGSWKVMESLPEGLAPGAQKAE